jgi:hypothetical protein
VEETPSARWDQYVSWLRACWQGRVQDVRTDLQQRQAQVGRPPPKEELPRTDARRADPLYPDQARLFLSRLEHGVVAHAAGWIVGATAIGQSCLRSSVLLGVVVFPFDVDGAVETDTV